jgi:hypothetical protein
MIRQEVSINDFRRIAKENEYFLWHFLQKEQESTSLGIWSIFKENTSTNKNVDNALIHILDKIDIPYFESYTQDSIDFLMDMGLDGKLLWTSNNFKNWYVDKKQNFKPIIIGFKRNKIITSTFEEGNCYCYEGIIELIGKLNPEFLLNYKID